MIWSAAYCSIACPIQPIVRPIAKSVRPRRRRQAEHARHRRRARSRGSASRRVSVHAASTRSRTKRSSGELRTDAHASSSSSAVARGSPRDRADGRSRRSRRPGAADRRARCGAAARAAATRASTRRARCCRRAWCPSSAASPATTTAYGFEPADATHRAVNAETLSSWSAQRIERGANDSRRRRSAERPTRGQRLVDRLVRRRDAVAAARSTRSRIRHPVARPRSGRRSKASGSRADASASIDLRASDERQSAVGRSRPPPRRGARRGARASKLPVQISDATSSTDARSRQRDDVVAAVVAAARRRSA